MAIPSSPSDPPPSTAAATSTSSGPRLLASPPPSRPPNSPLPQSHHHHGNYQPPSQTQPLYAPPHFSNIIPRVHPPTNSIHPQLAPKLPLNHDPQPQSQGLLYPVASSGRGFLQKPIPHQPSADQAGGFLSRPMVAAYPHSIRPYGFAHSDMGQTGHLIRPSHLQHTLLGSSGSVVPGVVKGVPVSAHPPVANCPSVSDCNGFKDTRERSKDDAFATVRDRKVRISEATSLYAVCRSWLRNGFHEEIQPQFMDGAKSLPRPFPVPVEDACSPVKKEIDKNKEKDEGSIEQLSPPELLQRHIKHAKKVRARLREERLKRIARYKTRLALLLPANVEQQFKNETAAGN